MNTSIYYITYGNRNPGGLIGPYETLDEAKTRANEIVKRQNESFVIVKVVALLKPAPIEVIEEEFEDHPFRKGHTE